MTNMFIEWIKTASMMYYNNKPKPKRKDLKNEKKICILQANFNNAYDGVCYLGIIHIIPLRPG